MPSKFAIASLRVATSAATGWVVGSWACRYPQVLRVLQNVVEVWLNRVPSALDRAALNSANDSLSHRSSHHRMVTRSPNHMCAISWAITSARNARSESVTAERNTNSSRNVTRPAFSIAPALNSGTNAWSYLPNGYRTPNRSWYVSKNTFVYAKISSTS